MYLTNHAVSYLIILPLHFSNPASFSTELGQNKKEGGRGGGRKLKASRNNERVSALGQSEQTADSGSELGGKNTSGKTFLRTHKN